MYGKRAGAVAGSDFSGIVEEIGSNVPHGLRSIGERVAGLVLGGRSPFDNKIIQQNWSHPALFLILSNPSVLLCFAGVGPQLEHPGAFSEYLVTYADFVVHVPDNWSFEDAAQLGIAPFTALMALYDLLDFPEPHLHESVPNPNPPQTSTGSTSIIPILISGGASSVGLYAIQLAKLSSLYVIATASERNFDLVRSFGADVVVNYRDPASAVKQIREAASAAGSGPIEHALDCVSTGTSFEIIAATLDGNGAIATLTLGSYPLVEGVKVTSGIIFDYFGKVRFPSSHHTSPRPRSHLLSSTECQTR